MQPKQLLLVAALSAPAFAQIPFAHPWDRSFDLLVVDSTFDGIWRCVDWNQDGDVNDPGEVFSWYDDTTGAIVLTNPTCISAAADGTVYIGDSTEDIIVALRDQNGDGDANDPGEYRVFFDAGNAGGLVMASVQGLHCGGDGRIYCAVSNAGTSGTDFLLVLQDIDGNGDANGPGEAIDYYTVPNVPVVGDSIPTELCIGIDAALYYTDIGASGVVQKGIYRAFDGDGNGNCNDPGEVTLFFATELLAANSPFHYGMAIDRSGRFYLTDHSSNDQVLTCFDANANGVIEAGEYRQFYATGGSTWWDVVVRDDGLVLLCEDQTPDRITALFDMNGDGDALDPGESWQIYDETVAQNPDLRPRGATFLRAPLLGVQPNSVQLGNTTNFTTSTHLPNNLCAVFLATGTIPPFSLPPFGRLEIDPSVVFPLGVGLSNANATFVQPFAVPNAPALVGTLAAQALCGDGFRLFLSNATALTVTP